MTINLNSPKLSHEAAALEAHVFADDIMSCSKKSRDGGLLELIAWGRAGLLRVGIEEAQEECERILMKLLGCARSELYLKEHDGDLSGTRERFLTLIKKRLQRIPLAYLLKEADFWQETLVVDERCLIPRPETEILVEAVIREMRALAAKSKDCHSRESGNPGSGSPTCPRQAFGDDSACPFSFLDIGTGSGAIAIAILRTFKNAQGTLLDISGEALQVARMNVEKYGLQDRVTFVQGDILNIFSEGFPHPGPLPGGEGKVRGRDPWDLIVSNPPYLSEEDWKGVQEELKFEPKKALDGGKDGLDFYRKIIAGAKDHLIPGGLLALEVGQGQEDTVSKWLQTEGYDNIQRFKDLLGIERVVIAKKVL